MATPWALLVGVQSLTALAAAYGAWRAHALHRLFPDRRLARLRLFFALFAASVAVHAIGGVQLWAAGLDTPPVFVPPAGAPPIPPGAPAPIDLSNPLVWHLPLAHVLLLGALLVGIVAFGTPGRSRVEAVAAALLLPGVTIGGAILVEGLLALYVAGRSLANAVTRRTPGAWRVGAGFGLLGLAHLAFVLLQRPGQARPLAGEVLALFGMVVLVLSLPRAGGR
jgi:hypothetical protein